MAAATVTTTEYGYSVTGGTDATTINTGKLWVKALAFSGDDDDDTATLTTSIDTGTTAAAKLISCYKFKSNANDDDSSMSYAYFGKKGVPMTNLAVTLNDTGSYLYVFIR